MTRRTGRTPRQMQDAPLGSAFVWKAADLEYPRSLASQLQRDDLVIVSPGQFVAGALRGLRCPGIVVDHAAELTPRAFNEIDACRAAMLVWAG